ncbi:unnamed protein product [Diabrotica balteata]|uniref:Uncharacterized protein n=1 Tax=Diabrotica balteata TaxID=107213 RepID=A0A9P0DVB6_DIABA|nr:unnamed protein product [Diabrotica balteata]
MTFNQFKEQIMNKDKDAQCVLKCAYVKSGALDKDGNVDVDVLWTALEKHGLDNPEVKNTFTECMKSAGKILTCDDVATHANCFSSIFKI